MCFSVGRIAYRLQQGGSSMKTMRSGLLVVALISVCASIGRAIEDKSLILYFPFDGDKGGVLKDHSGTGNDGEIIDGAKLVKGKFGDALEIDGANGSATVESSKSLESYQDHTLEFWFYYTEGANGSWRQLVAKRAPGTERVPGIWTNPGGVGIHWRIDPGNTGAGQIGPNGEGSNFDLKTWYHIAGAKQKDKLRIYINGKMMQEYNVPPAHTQGAEKLYIGKTTYGPAGFIIDELALYNRALTEKEVQQDMEGQVLPAAVSPSGKLATRWGALKRIYK
jgi:hypothetical protein